MTRKLKVPFNYKMNYLWSAIAKILGRLSHLALLSREHPPSLVLTLRIWKITIFFYPELQMLLLAGTPTLSHCFKLVRQGLCFENANIFWLVPVLPYLSSQIYWGPDRTWLRKKTDAWSNQIAVVSTLCSAPVVHLACLLALCYMATEFQTQGRKVNRKH